MDLLTKSLIKDLLPESIDGKEVTAIFGGGFKPPTSGHLLVIQKALKIHPEIDNIIIYVGSKIRDGVTQDQSFKVWDEHFKQLLDRPVRIEKSQSPIGDIYRYAKNNPEDTVYWVIGAREGREDDIQDITNRAASINKYPNLNLQTISTPDGGMSGTNARKALANNDKESLKSFLPSNVDYNEIWNILTSQPLNESIKIDMNKVNKALLSGMGKEKETDENLLALVDTHPQGRIPHTTFLNFYAKFDKYFGEKNDNRVLDEFGLEHILTRVLNLSSDEIKTVMNDYQKGNRDLEDVKWFEKYDNVHQKDEEWNPIKGEKFDDTQDNEEAVNQYLSKNKKLHEVIDNSFDKVKFYHDYYTNVSPSTFEITLEENNIKISNIVEPDPALPPPEDIRQIPVNQNLEEKKGFDKNLGKDPFGLNQFAREIMQEEEESYDTFNYPKHIKSLTKFMLDKGMKLRPLPTVKFINDDRENAKDFFGKTAYYDPNNHRVVLYTLNRHPKDVMRSFAHEMIHHMQNYEGKLQSIHTQNTNEEGDLPEIEREAYEKGNMTFRSWTDTLTEGILKEGRYDTLSNQISRDIFNFWKEDFDEGAKDSTYEDNYDFPPRGIQVYAQIIYKPESGKLKVDGGSDYAYVNKETGEEYPGFVKVTFIVDPKMLPEFWEEISMNLKDVVRHEIEHITQSGDSKTKKEDFDEEFDEAVRILVKADIIPQVEYFKLPKEIDANLQGMYFRAKKEKRPFADVINTYLDAQDITPKEKQIVLNLWRSRRKSLSLPEF